MGTVMVSTLPAGVSGVATLGENYICNAKYCILRPENGQLLTGADPEGTAGGEGEGWVRKGVGGAEAETPIWHQGKWGMAKGFRPPSLRGSSPGRKRISVPSKRHRMPLVEMSVVDCLPVRISKVKVSKVKKVHLHSP